MNSLELSKQTNQNSHFLRIFSVYYVDNHNAKKISNPPHQGSQSPPKLERERELFIAFLERSRDIAFFIPNQVENFEYNILRD